MKCYLIVVYEFKRELSWNCHLGTAILDSPLQKREGNWAELTFAKTSGTASREREKIGHYLIDPRNNFGWHFGSSFVPVSKVAGCLQTYNLYKRKLYKQNYISHRNYSHSFVG